MTLRPYQQEAVDAVIDWIKSSVDPCLIDAATGAGKSHIIASIADWVQTNTGKRVLCLAPSAELVIQNRAKYLATGQPASMFSASAGGKDTRHAVVFGTPLTVKNNVSRFASGFGAVVIDEAHGITPTLRGIIDFMREANPRLRVIGLTATPYRLGTGYIFDFWPDGKQNTEATAHEPYFRKLVYRITAPSLIKQGYLTKPTIGAIFAEGYDTGSMQVNARGQFDKADVDRAYHGHGRKTAAIVADAVAQSQMRRGVMFFAATIQHAEEVLASLPPELSAIVTGKTATKEREKILDDFKAQRIKYIVNVAVLTTGFDAPHVDVIALLRKTESVGLLQQIIGRGLRLFDGKADCLILDYTTNIDDHCPDGDLFTPVVIAKVAKGKGELIDAVCPDCGFGNRFSVAKHGEKFVESGWVDDAGYCTNGGSQRIETDHGALPAHSGRRCEGLIQSGALGSYERCGYRWTAKECHVCDAPNDIAARYCIECKAEIVDPNEKLKAEFRALKRDPARVQTDEILSMDQKPSISQRGNRTVRVDFVTPFRSFSVWYLPEATFSKQLADWRRFFEATGGGDHVPSSVTYQKETSGFYRVLAFGQPVDVEPENTIGKALEAAE